MNKWDVYRILLSLLLFGIIAWYANPFDALVRLSGVAPVMIAISSVGFLFLISLSTMGGWWLLRKTYHFRFFKLFPHYLSSWALEFYFPGKIGAFSILYFLEKEKVPKGTGLATVILIKFVTLFSAVGFSFFWLMKQTNTIGLETYLGIIVLVLSGIFLVVFTQEGRNWLRKLSGRFAVHFTGFSSSLNTMRKPASIAGIFVLAFASLVVQGIVSYLLLLQAGYEVGLFSMVGIVATVLLFGIIPLSFNGLGTREGVFVILLATINVPADVAFSVSIINTLVGYTMALIFTFFVVPQIINHRTWEMKNSISFFGQREKR